MIEFQGVFITEILLKSRTQSIYRRIRKKLNAESSLKKEKFKAHNSWLYKFKKHYNISLKNAVGSYEVNKLIYCEDFKQ